MPAPRRNQMSAPCQTLLSVNLRTIAVELPAATMGRQWPSARRSIITVPVGFFCCTVTMAGY